MILEIGSALGRMPEALGQGPAALAGDLDEAAVVGDLLEERQGMLGFRQFALVQVTFKLQERVVDPETVVLHAALKKIDEFLLAGQTFANLQKLRGGRVERVIEFDLAGFRPVVPAESFFTQVGNLAMHVQIQALEIVEFRNQLENPAAQRRTHVKGQSAGIFVQLADFIGGDIGIFLDADFDELRGTGFKNAPIREPVAGRASQARKWSKAYK